MSVEAICAKCKRPMRAGPYKLDRKGRVTIEVTWDCMRCNDRVTVRPGKEQREVTVRPLVQPYLPEVS